MTFNEVFNDYLLELEINIQQLSRNTGIEDSILYDYTKSSIPTVKYATILANYFNCSLNYLMGIDEEPNSYSFKSSFNISLFSDRYDELLKANNVSHYKLSKENGLNYSSHYSWQRGISVPSMSSLVIIANYFGVSIDYLVGRADEK